VQPPSPPGADCERTPPCAESSSYINASMSRFLPRTSHACPKDAQQAAWRVWLNIRRAHVPQPRAALSIAAHLGKHLPGNPTVVPRNEPGAGSFKLANELYFTPAEMGRPFAAPPGLPPEHTEMLRAAFDKSVADPELIAQAEKMMLEIEPLPGATVARYVDELYAAPREISDRVVSFRNMASQSDEKGAK
jgi:hypothetical protein